MPDSGCHSHTTQGGGVEPGKGKVETLPGDSSRDRTSSPNLGGHLDSPFERVT